MKLLKFLAVYLPFEEFILKWLPVGDHAYQVIRQVPEASLIAYLFFLILCKISSGVTFPKIGSNSDIYFALFLTSACVSLLANPDADKIIWFLSVKGLIRYILIIYIVLILQPTTEQIQATIRLIALTVAAQIMVGAFQLFGGIYARDILAARRVTDGINGIAIDFTGDRFEGVNDIFGTMGNTINFAYFMLIGLTLWIFSHKENNIKFWFITIFIFIFIFLTGSRGSMLAGILLIIGHQIWSKGWKNIIFPTLTIIAIIIPMTLIQDIYSNTHGDGSTKSVSSLFTDEYLEAALNQRLGVIVYIAPNVLFNVENLLGFVSTDIAVDYIQNKLPTVPNILISVLALMMDDVYWVAMYLYYGIAGFFFFSLFLISIYINIRRIDSKSTTPLCHRLAMISISLLLISIPLNFINQTLVTRAFSYYLWLFCALALASSRTSKSCVDENGNCTGVIV